MKKTFIKIAVSAAALIIFAAGGYYIGRKSVMDIQNAIPKESVSETMPQSSENVKPDEPVTYITRSTLSSVEDGDWEVSESYTGRITDGDGDDTLRIYYSPENSEEQTWAAEIETSDGGYYTLTNQSLTNGRIYAEVDEIKGGGKSVTLVLSSQSGVSVKRYTYSESGFKEEKLENRAGAAVLYSSFSNN